MNLYQEKFLSIDIEQDNLPCRITKHICDSSDLKETLKKIIAELSLFLGIDRVMVYQFSSDNSGQVVAESIKDGRLPSLLGLNFPADDIPSHAREMFIKSRVVSIVDVEAGWVAKSPVYETETGETILQDISYRSVDPCHVEYLTAMGVRSSIVTPIFHEKKLWGLLVAHHSESYAVSEKELKVIQMVVGQFSVAITHNQHLKTAREQAKRESIISNIAQKLHSSPDIPLESALKEVINVFEGCGGRLCIENRTINSCSLNFKNLTGCFTNSLEANAELIQVYTSGRQPKITDSAKCNLMEQHHIWQEYYKSGIYDVWAISDIHQVSDLENLQTFFQTAGIRSLLMIPLEYNQQLLGYLSIFREAVDTETLWAGKFDSDKRQIYPRKSFETWRESKNAQAREWNQEEIKLARDLGKQFAGGIHQKILFQEIQSLNSNLESRVKERTEELQQATKQQQILFDTVIKIRESLDLDVIFRITTKEVCQSLQADRVAVYRFNEDWSGEFIAEFVHQGWVRLVGSDIKKVWKDTFLEKTQGGRYRFNESMAVDDIYQAGFKDCHIEILEQFQAKAHIIAPIMIGNKLWGLLATYQNSTSRKWKQSEIKFLSQTATQFGMAIEQAELLAQTKQQAISLQQISDQQRLLFNLVANMRKSLDFDTIFQVATKELRRILNTSRVGVYRFDPNSEHNYGELISEDILPSINSALEVKIKDACFGKNYANKYRYGRINVVPDVHNAGFKDCHVAILDKFQVKASIIAPIMNGEELWGLLCIHQCDKTREWKNSEIEFSTQVANQLSVGLEHANLLAQSKLQTKQIGITLDNLRKTQTQLIQSEKMSSLGQLVAGIAHEINNPVNFIYGNLTHVNQYTEDLLSILKLYQQGYNVNNSDIQERAEEIDLDFLIQDLPKIISSIQVGASRIREIVLSLRNFSRLDEADLKIVDIHEGIESTLLMLQYRLKSKVDSPGIEVIKEYANLPQIACYAGQLNQVLMNVLSNAIDALEEGVSHSFWEENTKENQSINPKIRISTKINKNDNRVIICIADNGLGMNEKVIKRMFDPFFTTKPIGKGTGLGLSISYQIIVDKHGGVFDCQSILNRGTEFRIEIPIK